MDKLQNSEILPPIHPIITPPSKLPTISNPIFGEKPKFFPNLLRTISFIGKNIDFESPLFYYDNFSIPTIKYQSK